VGLANELVFDSWSNELVALWKQVEQFWRIRDEQFSKTEQRTSPVKIPNFRRKVFDRANEMMRLLDDMGEPVPTFISIFIILLFSHRFYPPLYSFAHQIVMWSEGLRIFAANKAAIAFFGRSAEEMTNAPLGYEGFALMSPLKGFFSLFAFMKMTKKMKRGTGTQKKMPSRATMCSDSSIWFTSMTPPSSVVVWQ